MPPTELELAGHRVGRVGYGAMQLTAHDRLAVSPETATAVLRAAVEQGVRHVDTAQFYGNGALNRLIAAVLAATPDLLVATKIGAVPDPETRLRAAQQPAELRAQVEQNLTSLGTDRLGLVYLRRVDAPPGIVATGDQLVDLDSQLAELISLREQGKIGAIGLGSVSAAQLAQALPAGIAAVQNQHSLVDSSAEPVLELCRAHGVAWVPYFPLGSGFPGFPKVTEQPAVIAAAAELGVTPAQVGLAWLLHRYDRTALIPGTRDPAHLTENLAAAAVTLPGELVERLSARPDPLPR